MAGDWIKLEHATPDKPEIVSMADLLNIDHDAAFGKCMRLWIWADQQTVDGNDLPVTPSFIDRLTNCPGFSDALISVGWLISCNGRFSIPNFARHNGQSAKNRALTKERVKRSRNGSIVTSPLPEKRREEKSKKKPQKVSSASGSKREPDRVWDAICAIWSLKVQTEGERKRVGKLARDYKLKIPKDRDPDRAIRERITRYKATYPKAAVTPDAILKHWDQVESHPLADGEIWDEARIDAALGVGE